MDDTGALDFTRKATLLVVDDTPDNLALMSGILKDRYIVKVATDGERALKLAHATHPDLILLDVMMPGIDGYEVCRRLKCDPDTMDIPVIFLTAKIQVEDEQRGFAVGAVDYITKPISPPVVLSRVQTHLDLAAARTFLKDRNAFLEDEIRRRTEQITRVQDVTIMAMASLAETRDNDTGNHIRRTQHYVRTLAEQLRDHPRFRTWLTAENIDTLFKSAPLHDIGKVGIPDRILLKPGRFTPEEFEYMKQHTTFGRDAIAAAEALIDTPSTFLAMARQIAYSHQEKWDGSGYPQGLAGESIPIAARLMAVADVYDALISRRVYKDPIPHRDAVEIIVIGRSAHFDPDIVDAFVAVEAEFRRIAMRFADTEDDIAEKRLEYERRLGESLPN